MRNQRQRRIAIEAMLGAALLAAGQAWAGTAAGTVAHLNGPLLAKRADGTIKVLAQNSAVESGDTLVSEKNTYAQIRFVDNGEITLQPGTTFRIDNFVYEPEKPESDSAAFSLVAGGVRSVTGLLGKRNHDRFSLTTPDASIGVRGTTFIVQYAPPSQNSGAGGSAIAGPQAPGKSLPPGLYVQVIDGLIVLNNKSGSQGFQAGQFGFVASNVQPPVVVPSNPGLQFTPPPVFNAGPGLTGANGSLPARLDCVVR
jgi:hypothetical protein